MPDDTTNAITDLQMRAMHLERHVESLDEVVREQFTRIEKLERELLAMRERLAASGSEEGPSPDGSDEPPPPHY